MLASRGALLRATTLVAVLLLPACWTLDDPADAVLTRPVVLTITPDTIDADGVSRADITAQLQADTPLGAQLIFDTDAGSLVGGAKGPAQEVTLNAGARTVHVGLIAATTATTATVSVKTGSSVYVTTVLFAPALPSSLQLTTDVASIKADGRDAAVATASLLRAPGHGVVSVGTRVLFDVSLGGIPQSDLSGLALTDVNGRATWRLVTRAAGTYQIVARDSTVADTVTVVANAP